MCEVIWFALPCIVDFKDFEHVVHEPIVMCRKNLTVREIVY